MVEIILIQPKAGIFDRVGARLPIGVLSAAAIPYSKGVDVRIIDQRTDDDWVDWIEQYIDDNTVCIGITCMTGSQIRYALEVSKYVKDNYPSTPIIWGGVHPTLISEETLVNPYIDMIIRKEGDHTFYEVYDALKNKNLLMESRASGISVTAKYLRILIDSS